MQYFKKFSMPDLIRWFLNERSDTLKKLIYLSPVAPQSLDIFLPDIDHAHRETERHKLITEHYF